VEQCIVDLTSFIEFNFSRYRLFNVNFTCVDDLTIRTHYFNTATTSEKALKYDVTATTSEKALKYDVTTTTSERPLSMM
jgi:hypothetical protein